MKAIGLTALTVLGMVYGAMAQLSPMKSQYFQNQYLGNPAMAARDGSTSLYSSYSRQWDQIEGSPVMMSLSGSAPLSSKAALGFNLISDKAGLLKRTQGMGSFAYKIPLKEDRSLRFGFSIAWTLDKLDYSSATSNGLNDPSLMRYNDARASDWDGNVGIAYIGKKLEAQFSYLSLNQKRSQKFTTVDYSTFNSSVSYKFELTDDFRIKPMVAYRGVHNYKNQWDAAVEWGVFNPDFNLYTMYHSNKSISGGFGYVYENKLILSAIFTSEPGALRGFTEEYLISS